MTLKRAEYLPKACTPGTMATEEIVKKFADALEQFEPICSQPSGTDLTQIHEVVAPLLLQIP